MARLREAEKAAQQAVRHAEFVGEPALMALTSTGRAELRIELGDVSFAYSELERAAALAEQADDVIGGAEVRRIRALAALRDGRHRVAADEAEAARRIAEEHGVALLRSECAAIEARAWRFLGDSARAEARRSEAVAGFTRLGATRLLAAFEAEWAAGG
jgi:hypothetical protein